MAQLVSVFLKRYGMKDKENKMPEIVDVTILAHFTDTRIGSVSRKQRIKLPILIAEEFESIGLVQIENPQKTVSGNQSTAPLGVGMAKLSELSPVGQASQKKIVSSSEKQVGELLQSTTVGSEHNSQTSYTHATDSGGNITTNESAQNLKVNSGRKTNGRKKLSE